LKKEIKYFEDLLTEINRLRNLKGSGNWDEVRSADNFTMVERKYSFGTRNCYKLKTDIDPVYTSLQASRGLSWDEITSAIEKSETSENVINNLDTTQFMIPDDGDLLRVKEIEQIWDMPQFDVQGNDHSGFVELGFRAPKLMKHYGEKYDIKTWGYDIIPLSIAVAQKMGYDGRLYDFNNCSEPLDLANASLVVSYHMLEHLSDPLVAVEKIYESMDKGAFFHVEVPIEPGIPRLRYAHMFAFHHDDMLHMLRESGFTILTVSTSTHEGGGLIERYMVRKI